MAEKFSKMADKKPSFQDNKSQIAWDKVVVVIIVVAFSLLAFYFIVLRDTDNTEPEDTSDQVQQEEIQEEEEEPIVEDETDEEEIIEEDEEDDTEEEVVEEIDMEGFSTGDQELGEESAGEIRLSSFSSSSQDEYLRLEFALEEASDVYVTASLNNARNGITLKFFNVEEDNTSINVGNSLDIEDSIVSNVFHQITSEENVSIYVVGIYEETPFKLHMLEDSSMLYLDVAERDYENGNGDEFAFSTDAQSFEGNAEGSPIVLSGLSHSNQGGVYRHIFRLGSVGEGTVPAVSAQIVDYEGGKAVKMVMSNMNSDFAAQDNISQDYNDTAVTGLRGSFASSTSTYYIKLTSVREYKLYYRTAPAQVILDVMR